ncbi:MAG: xanthine dehydrogenase family protein subunit M [Chloroflexia bacterium]|nr:xanthine dehydrogenase family protein subunit M [Chloroflexia bacterium]
MLGVFDIVRPKSVADASAIVAAGGGEAVFYAGGTELLILMKDRLLEPAVLVDLKAVPGLDGIGLDPGGRTLRIGALARHRQIERSPIVRHHVPTLAALEARVANVRVRHAGTIGGNLCFAEPHSDPATLLLALEATFTLESEAGARDVAAADFFVGFLQTARQPDELMTSTAFPLPDSGTTVAYERFKTHERPSASVAVLLSVRDGTIAAARIAVGSVGDRPVRMPAAEAALRGTPPGPESFAAAAEIVRDGVEPTEDRFESTDYKRHLAGTLTRRALERAMADGESHGR